MASRKRLNSVISPLLNVKLQLEKRFKQCNISFKPGFTSYYLSCNDSQLHSKSASNKDSSSDIVHIHADSGI